MKDSLYIFAIQWKGGGGEAGYRGKKERREESLQL